MVLSFRPHLRRSEPSTASVPATTEREALIEASAATVFALIANPMRMADWSPECVRCRWIGDSAKAEIGARFRGTSRNGRRRWTTTSLITEKTPEKVFAWEVTYFRQPVARWEYRIEPAERGVRLIEAVHDRRGRILRAVSPIITGSPDRAARNSATMDSTLDAVRSAAERGPAT